MAADHMRPVDLIGVSCRPVGQGGVRRRRAQPGAEDPARPGAAGSRCVAGGELPGSAALPERGAGELVHHDPARALKYVGRDGIDRGTSCVPRHCQRQVPRRLPGAGALAHVGRLSRLVLPAKLLASISGR